MVNLMGSANDLTRANDETVMLLFLLLAILVVLLLILVTSACQTWMLWKLAKAVVEQDAKLTRGGASAAAERWYTSSADSSGSGYVSNEGKKRGVESVESGRQIGRPNRRGTMMGGWI